MSKINERKATLKGELGTCEPLQKIFTLGWFDAKRNPCFGRQSERPMGPEL
jgi:hypothetical protein